MGARDRSAPEERVERVAARRIREGAAEHGKREREGDYDAPAADDTSSGPPVRSTLQDTCHLGFGWLERARAVVEAADLRGACVEHLRLLLADGST